MDGNGRMLENMAYFEKGTDDHEDPGPIGTEPLFRKGRPPLKNREKGTDDPRDPGPIQTEPQFRQVRKNKAYFDFFTNSIVLEVDPTSSAKDIRSVILDGAEAYSEKIYSVLEMQLKDSKHRIRKRENSGNFSSYMYERRHYEELEKRLADDDKGKPEDPVSGDPFEPKVVAHGFRPGKIFDFSRKDFKEVLYELRTDAKNKKAELDDKYSNLESFCPGFACTGMFSMPLPTRHFEKKYDKTLRTYNALDYMSKKLEFQQYSCCAPTVKNTATASYARKA